MELSRDVEELTSLAGDLLELASATPEPAGTITVRAAWETVRSMVDTGDEPAAELLDTITDDATFGTATVPLSGRRLGQVLSNLLTNAAVHGRAPVTVSIALIGAPATTTSADPGEVTTTGEPLVLRRSVTDQGSGLPIPFLPHAADRFARADEARDRSGAGLGLALVNAVLQPVHGELRLCAHGVHQRYSHQISAACEHPDLGTTATVLLPASRRPSPGADRAPPAGRPATS